MRKLGDVNLMLLLLLATCLFACATPTTVSGQPDQWVRAKRFSVMISFAQDKISIRNDSAEEVSFLPMKIRGWYKTAGDKEITLNHAEKEKLKPNDSISPSIPPFLGIEAAPQVGIPQSNDQLQRVEVELSQGGNREIVTVSR